MTDFGSGIINLADSKPNPTGLTGPSPCFPEILELHGKWRAEHPALIVGDKTLSWAQLTLATNQFANGLIEAGLQKGDIIAVQMQNSWQMAVAILGIAKAGCVSAPLNLSVTDDAILAMIKDAKAKALIASDDQAIRMEPYLANVTLTLKIASETKCETAGWFSFETWLDQQEKQSPAVKLHADDPFNIIYSSGTTGQPKGILHTHQTRLDWAYDLCIALRYHGGTRTICTLGLYSNIAWVQMLCTWLAGGTLILTRQFDAGQVLQQIEQDKITHTAMVPVQFQRLLDHPDAGKTDFSSMQAMMSCGSPLHEELKARIFDAFDCGIIELYGLTEGVITTLEPEDAKGRLASVGRPLIGTDLCLLDANDQVCATGEAGEIVSRGRIVMPGYHNRPDANFESTWVDDLGQKWIRTGDIGKLDAQGYLYIVDRKKDMILSGGQNIYPADIEAVLIEHTDIRDAAVIGVPSKDWGETPVAWVETEKSKTLDPNAIRDWTNERVGKRQRIFDVLLIDEIPRNANGKILKRNLRELYQREKNQ